MKLKRVIVRKRIFIVYLVMIIMFFILMVRLSYLKIVEGKTYYEKALDLWTRSAPVRGTRGNIYDRNGELIVGNTLTPTLIAIPKQIENVDYTSRIIARILKVEVNEIKKHLEKNVSVEIIKPEALKIEVIEALEIIKCDLPGIYIVGDTSRYYPYQNTLASVIGFTGIDNQGIAGLEYIYENELKGKGGNLKIFTDAHGSLINNLTSYYVNPNTGYDVYLTIDLALQLTVERVLDNIVNQYQPDDAIILVMNPQNSEVLAMGNRPTFDPSNYQAYDEDTYNRNLAIWKAYEAGSTFKIMTFAAGLEEDVFKLDERFFDSGYAVVDGTKMRDWKKGGHGEETFLEVLQNSCNPGFVAIDLRLGKERFFNYLKKFGLGSKTGIDLLGESKGILFDPDKIGNVELATSAFGQGNAVTPIQLVNASMAAVNGGYLYKPYIVKKIMNKEQVILEKEPVLIRQVISKETSEQVASSLEHVVSLGTGRNAYIEGYRVGGKTGVLKS